MQPRAVLHRAALGAACIAASALAADAGAGTLFDYHEISGHLSVDGRWYPHSAAHPDQRDQGSGFAAAPRLYLEDAEGRSLTFEAFYRYDSADERRTHADLREAYLLLFGEAGDDEWELRLGIDRIFWGVAESRHLVDVVNQIDLVEHPNEEAKLGQPMAHVTWSGEWGSAELFALPYHRLRPYPGRQGRLRAGLVVDNDRARYESAAEEWHLDLTARYSHSVGPFDFGVSVFDGTSREPSLAPGFDRNGLSILRDGAPILIPYYEQIRQFGLDAQMTSDAWLLKLEAIRRTGARNLFGMEEDYTAFVAGGEYTLYSVFDSGVDLGLLGEWNRDGRRLRATNVFQNDAFLGARLAFNDVESTDVIAGMLFDADVGTRTFSAELNRRLSNQWFLHVEATLFQNVDMADPVHETRRDSFVELNLIYNF